MCKARKQNLHKKQKIKCIRSNAKDRKRKTETGKEIKMKLAKKTTNLHTLHYTTIGMGGSFLRANWTRSGQPLQRIRGAKCIVQRVGRHRKREKTGHGLGETGKHRPLSTTIPHNKPLSLASRSRARKDTERWTTCWEKVGGELRVS